MDKQYRKHIALVVSRFLVTLKVYKVRDKQYLLERGERPSQALSIDFVLTIGIVSAIKFHFIPTQNL